MPRYIAFLRGVSPMNCQMPELKECLEDAGFAKVKTLLSSGNVAFDARSAPESALERKLEAAMESSLGRSFYTIVRPADALQALLMADPFAAFELPHEAKRVVSFLREPADADKLELPLTLSRARILAVKGREIFSAYEPGDKTPVFMTLIERTFGKDITTRTWETVRKCAAA